MPEYKKEANLLITSLYVNSECISIHCLSLQVFKILSLMCLNKVLLSQRMKVAQSNRVDEISESTFI